MEHGSDLRPGRVKKTRPKAARLAPAGVDEGTTNRLFDEGQFDEEPVGGAAAQNDIRGRHFAGNGERPSALRAANDEVVLDLADARTPLVRYEWRNRAGETMVVEAAWPFDSSQAAEFEEPIVRREPGFDYPSAS